MSITRREFIGTAMSAVGAGAFAAANPLALPEPKPKFEGSTPMLDDRPPIQVYCLGWDDDPATEEDIEQVVRWVNQTDCNHGSPLCNLNPRPVTATYSGRPGVSTHGRIPIVRKGMKQSIRCRHYVVEPVGHGYFVCRVGSETRPASYEDLRTAQRAIAKALEGTPLIVTHHNFDLRWFRIESPRGLSWSPPWRGVILPYEYGDRSDDAARDAARMQPHALCV